MSDFVQVFALVALILTVAALAAGLVERSPLSFPLMFLAIGFVLGKSGLGLIDITTQDEALGVVATLTLSLVLSSTPPSCSSASWGGGGWCRSWCSSPDGADHRLEHRTAGAAVRLRLGTCPHRGAVLASTDPVVLREIVRDERIPRSVRQVLRIEAGMNDIVVLPIVLILIAVAVGGMQSVAGWAEFLARLLLVGPLLGLAIGGAGAWLMKQVDRMGSIRREYQALYVVGLVLASYTAAVAAGGDGFLSAFAAGVSVVLLNQKLCDYFLEYGEVTSEMAMMAAFVLFGALLSGIWDTVPLVRALLMSALVILAIRPGVLGLVLSRARMSREAHAFIAWFGPRGLNSLLCCVGRGSGRGSGAEMLLGVVGVVVLVSVTLHGASASPASAWYGRRASKETLVEERESTAAGLFVHEEVGRQHDRAGDAVPAPVRPQSALVLDVRSRSSYEGDGQQIPRSVRVLPDQIAEWVRDLPRHRLAVSTAPATTRRPAPARAAATVPRLRRGGPEGGIETWRKLYPTEPTTVRRRALTPQPWSAPELRQSVLTGTCLRSST